MWPFNNTGIFFFDASAVNASPFISSLLWQLKSFAFKSAISKFIFFASCDLPEGGHL